MAMTLFLYKLTGIELVYCVLNRIYFQLKKSFQTDATVRPFSDWSTNQRALKNIILKTFLKQLELYRML